MISTFTSFQWLDFLNLNTPISTTILNLDASGLEIFS
jgi:hypothetical protein